MTLVSVLFVADVKQVLHCLAITRTFVHISCHTRHMTTAMRHLVSCHFQQHSIMQYSHCWRTQCVCIKQLKLEELTYEIKLVHARHLWDLCRHQWAVDAGYWSSDTHLIFLYGADNELDSSAVCFTLLYFKVLNILSVCTSNSVKLSLWFIMPIQLL